MAALLETFASYVPAMVARRYLADPTPLSAPVVERFPAAVFFADISGFTALSEQLAQHGPAGAELTGSLLNTYFGQLIALITEHGGEVVKFAGDGLLAIWPAAELRESLPTVTRRAVQCGIAVQQRLHEYQPISGMRLTQRVGIGAGEVYTAHLGGVFGRWELLLAGDPLLQVSKAEQEAQPGQITVSAEAWELTQPAFVGHRLPSGAVLVEAAASQLPPRSATLPIPTPESEAALRAYIPGAILSRLSAGQTEWLAELRRVTILFINLPDLNYAAPVEQAQQVMRVLQTSLYRYEGSINKFSVDDKGVTLVAALGLPPLAHEDDAARGAQAALLLQSSLRDLGLRSAVGITTGRAFCGSVGGATRREYTMVGDVVNLAARLMQAAPGDILCDLATWEAAHHQIAFDTLPPILVKGKAEPVPVFRPLGSARGTPILDDLTATAGRLQERAVISGPLEALRQSGTGSVLILEGDAGIGKSHLARDLAQQAVQLGLDAVAGYADATERATPYYAWRAVFTHVLGLDILPDAEARRGRVLGLLQASPDAERSASLLNPVLMLDLPDSDITSEMSGETRAEATRDVLLRLLESAAAEAPRVVVLENAQWLDSASWALAAAAGQSTFPLLLTIVTRPVTEPVPPDYLRLRETPSARWLRVGELAPDEIETLVCRRLGVRALPPSVAALVRIRAEGNPFFSEQLAYALRDTGLLRISGGECRLAPEAGDLRDLHLPDTVQGLITSRIDRLPPPHQLALKVASVIGRAFPYRLLEGVYPLAQDRARLPEYLRVVQDLDLITSSESETEPVYSFRNTVTLEVSYNLMLFAQRRDLHRAVAEWYERECADDLSPHYPLLAHHWGRAGDVSTAMHYLDRAAEQALRSYANQEAAGFLQELLRHDAAPEQAADAPARLPQRVRWERQLGQAYYGMGDLHRSRDHLQQAAALLGQPTPSNRPGLAIGLGRQAARQMLYHTFPGWYVGRGHTRRAALLEAARVHALLGEVCYFTADIPEGIYHTLATLNLSELAGPSPELARAYGNMTIAAGLVPLRSLAEGYSQRARHIAAELDHLPVAAQVFWLTGVYAVGQGRWPEARDQLDYSMEIAERTGDRLQWNMTRMSQAVAAHFQNHFAKAADMNADAHAVAQRAGNLQQQAWSLSSHAENALRLGHLEEAARLLNAALPLLERDIRRANAIRAYGTMAAVCLRLDQRRLAHQAADQVLRTIGNGSSSLSSGLEGYSGAAEAYLWLWETSDDESERRALAQQAQRAVTIVEKYAKLFPVGEPRAALLRGWYDHLRGQHVAASAAWARSAAAAERLEMPYELGLTLYEAGRNTTGAEAEQSLGKALALFTQLGATHDFERTQTALGRLPARAKAR